MFGSTNGCYFLDSWVLANIVQLGTQQFCRQFLNRRNDPCGRQYDQMTQAARSGCANIAEGSARRATSRQTEMTPTSSVPACRGGRNHPDCARKSLQASQLAEVAAIILIAQKSLGKHRCLPR